MSILTLSNVGQSFGAVDVFAGISASIPNDGKIGLVGPNGIGKSTLLQIIAGLSQPTTGNVHRARGSRLGYLRQEAAQAFAGRENSVYEEMLTVFATLRAQESQLRELEERLAHGASELLEQYGAAQERFERAGGYEYDLRIQQVLEGLGFQRSHWELPLNHLSGGQMTRALLARLLLEQPDLLILDEPTNHLDVGAIEWLEQTLWRWEGALLVVSHDRYFLDKVVDRIWEMDRAHLEFYRGNYSAYVQQRQERWERHQQLYEAEKERLEKELEFIRRHIAGQSTDIATGKLKRLSRDLVALEEVGLMGMQGKSWSELELGRVRTLSVAEAAERIKSFRAPMTRPPRLNIKLKVSQRGGALVLRTKALAVGYPGNPLFEAGDISLYRGECAALIGPNGAGKTTFLRTILGQLEPMLGEVELGSGLKVGYFAQAHDRLNLDNTVIDEIMRHRPMSSGEARSYLAQYLFREDDVWKQVRALSGGERGRLALAILALQGANLLLLDEPTNHLDIPAQEVLQQVLESFEGTILLVSHDRYLVDRLSTQIWEVREGRLHIFEGSYKELLSLREQAKAEARGAVETQRQGAKRQQETTGRDRRKQAERLAQLESQITELEGRLEQLEQELQQASEAQQVEAIQRFSHLYTRTQTELEQRMVEWELLAESIS